jgi:glycosyltransferase involved in cell wall biosynthesis
MADKLEPPNLSILHVLTLNGRNGEYGGPVRVARELCTELNARGFETHIFSGAVQGSDPVAKDGLSESFVHVKPLSEKFGVSSLWSRKLFRPLIHLIKESDLIHIHFARDLIPFLTGILAIIYRKPFVAQTHGMIISDGRISTRIVDFMVTRPVINKSKKILVLTEKELKDARNLNFKPVLEILPNGIKVDLEKQIINERSHRVIFCSRLEKRKRVDRFLELSSRCANSSLSFEIYGPNGGELEGIEDAIMREEPGKKLAYKGALKPSEVMEVLEAADLLILPSDNEPFPMIVLEALAVGTPVLVMGSCGISEELASFCKEFVSSSDDVNGLIESMNKILEFNSDHNPERIRFFANAKFGIVNIVNKLELFYKQSLGSEK